MDENKQMEGGESLHRLTKFLSEALHMVIDFLAVRFTVFFFFCAMNLGNLFSVYVRTTVPCSDLLPDDFVMIFPVTDKCMAGRTD